MLLDYYTTYIYIVSPKNKSIVDKTLIYIDNIDFKEEFIVIIRLRLRKLKYQKNQKFIDFANFQASILTLIDF